MGIEVIFFDLDDTLVVEKKSAVDALIEASKLAEKKYGIDPVKLQETVMACAREIWYSLPTHAYAKKIAISSWEALWADFKGGSENQQKLSMLKDDYRFNSWKNALIKFKINDDMLAEELSKKFPEERRKKHTVYPDTDLILRILGNNFKLGLITNGSPGLQWEKIKGAGIKCLFEHIIISGEVGISKPSKIIFDNALNKFGVNSDNAVMIGNSLESDIIGAGSVGIKTIWINRDSEKNNKNIKPDYVITSLSELPELMIEIVN